MRWLIAGLPLALYSCGFIWLATKDVAGTSGLLMFSLLYMTASICASSSNRNVRKIAVIAWLPLLLAVPIGTILGVLAIRLLLDNPEARSERKAKVKMMTHSEIQALIHGQAELVLEISDRDFDSSIELDLKVPPVELTNFLDGLSIEYGLPISSSDQGQVDSVQDIVRLVINRSGDSANTARIDEPSDRDRGRIAAAPSHNT